VRWGWSILAMLATSYALIVVALVSLSAGYATEPSSPEFSQLPLAQENPAGGSGVAGGVHPLMMAPGAHSSALAPAFHDPRIGRNPLLAAIARNSPAKLPGFLHELDQLTPRTEVVGAAIVDTRPPIATGNGSGTSEGAVPPARLAPPSPTVSAPSNWLAPTSTAHNSPPDTALRAPTQSVVSLAPGVVHPGVPYATPPGAIHGPAVMLTQEDVSQLRINPDIASAYRANPDPMLELLRRMMEAAKSG
jgi:hypothetical protein